MTLKMKLVILVFALLSHVAYAGTTAGRARRERIEVSAEIGWGGWIRENRRAPAFITLENHGRETHVRITLQVGVTSKNDYIKDVVLPPHSRRMEILYFRVTPFSGQVELKVDEIAPNASSARFRFNRIFSTELVSEQKPMIVIFSDSRAGQEMTVMQDPNSRFYWMSQSGVQLIYRRLQPLPDRWYGYEGIDAVVISDASPRSIDQSSLRTLKDWMERGGRVAILGGDTGIAVKGTLLERVLPVSIAGTTHVGDLAKESFGRRLKWKGTTLLADYSDKRDSDANPKREGTFEGSTWFGGMGQSFGKGHIFFIPYNDLRPPIAGSKGWKSVIAVLAVRTEPSDWIYWQTQDYGGHWLSMMEVLNDIPALALPSRKKIGLLLFGYLLLLGPLHWLIARKVHRRIAWVTFPLTIAAFTFITFREGRRIKGTHVLVQEVSIARMDTTSPRAQMQSLIGILSPEDSRMSIVPVHVDTLLRRPPVERKVQSLFLYRTRPYARSIPRMSVTVSASSSTQNEPYVKYRDTGKLSIEDVRFKWGAMQLFASLSTPVLGKGFDCALSTKDSRLSGTIENHSGYDLEDVMIACLLPPPKVWKLGTFKNGQSIDVGSIRAREIDVQELYRDGQIDILPHQSSSKVKTGSRHKLIMRSVTDLLWTSPLSLVGFVKNPRASVTVKPGPVESRATTILLVRLRNLRISPGTAAYRSGQEFFSEDSPYGFR